VVKILVHTVSAADSFREMERKYLLISSIAKTDKFQENVELNRISFQNVLEQKHSMIAANPIKGFSKKIFRHLSAI
jgi:hypothetical protein